MSKPDRYHHGDLRAALLDAARRALDEHGHEKLSLARITASLGVSAAAPYRHFSSKEALLETLVEVGLAEFLAKAEAAARTPGTTQDKLRAACEAYLDYAEKMPGLFRLLMSSADGRPYLDGPPGRVHQAYNLFEEAVRLAAPGLSDAAARDVTATMWAQVHGYVVLSTRGLFKRVTGRLPPRDMIIEAAVRLPAMVEAWDRGERQT